MERLLDFERGNNIFDWPHGHSGVRENAPFTMNKQRVHLGAVLPIYALNEALNDLYVEIFRDSAIEKITSQPFVHAADCWSVLDPFFHFKAGDFHGL